MKVPGICLETYLLQRDRRMRLSKVILSNLNKVKEDADGTSKRFKICN